MPRSAASAVDMANHRIALSGHPGVSWSVVLEARVGEVPDATGVAERLAASVGEDPRLVPPPPVRSTGPEDLAALRAALADGPYRPGASPMRVALVSGPEPRVVLAAHHGVLDGLGLLALLGVVLDAEVSSSVTGLGTTPPERSFVSTAARRLAEAAFAPPTRISPRRTASAGPDAGDELAAREVPAVPGGAPALVAASVRAVRAWNRAEGDQAERIVVAVGASRRPGSSLGLDERSAYLRLRIGSGPVSEGEVRASLRTAAPQPGGPPVRAAALLGRLSGLASDRLGSTLLVSSLGSIEGPPALRSIAFHPVAHGRSGVAVGAATVGSLTTITIRARRRDFDASGAADLLDAVVAELRS